MPSTNTKLQDKAIDHAIDERRYSNWVVQRMIAVLNRSDARIAAQLSEALLQMDADSFTVERLEALLTSLRSLNEQAYAQVYAALQEPMQGMATAEAQYQAASLRAAIPPPVQLVFPVAAVAPEQAYAAALSRPFQGRLLSGWMQALASDRAAMIRNAVRAGYVEGRTASEIVRGIRGTRALNYADGLLDRPRRELATIVNTALSHTAQTARSLTVDANLDIVKAVKWVSTLDGRTSPMCRVRDGLQYTPGTHKPVGHKVPWLQGPGRLHFNCRSVSVPVTKSWRELGIDADEMPAGTRASMDGQVAADTTYGQWLSRQSAARQDEILGPRRGRLLRSGQVTFDKFHDDKGRWLTLAQLLARVGG